MHWWEAGYYYYYFYYFSQCQEAHKAWTSFLHLGRFEAAWRAVFQEFQPALFLSTSTIRLQVVFGRPLFLLPSGVHPKATAQSFVGSFRSTWPIQFHLFLLTSSLIFPAPASSRTVAFDTCCCHRILKILLRHFVWKMSSFSSSPLVNFHVSHPYNRTAKTRLLKRDALVFLPMSVACQMLESLLKAALASAILFLMSAVLPPSLLTLAPRYVNLSTSSTSLWPIVRWASLLLQQLERSHIVANSQQSAQQDSHKQDSDRS